MARCGTCKSWLNAQGNWGSCICPAMAIDFTPYSQPEAQVFNHDRPSPIPRTAIDYSCVNWS